MAEERRHDAEGTPVTVTPTEDAPAESTAPSQSVAIAQTPESSVETHTQAEIDLDNLRERNDVLPMDSAPPADQQADVPADLEELRQTPATARPARPPVVDNERRYGPLSGSMWFLVVAIVAFVLTLILRLLG
jgi:hypothetical protein